MSRSSSPFNKQNELVRSLRKQLAATERELAGQKWLFEQFLQSPSWRLTLPIRWIAKQLRSFRQWLNQLVGRATDNDLARSSEDNSDEDALVPEVEAAPDQKQLFTDLQSIQLKSFLTSVSRLELPHSDDPEISVILVLFNRAELTFACLR